MNLTLSQDIGKEQDLDVCVSKEVKSSELKSLGGDYTKGIVHTDSGASISGSQPYIKKETEASVSLTEKDETVENAVIRGDLYIGASGVILEDVQVDGTLYINPGISGICNMKNVTAQRVEILSGLSTEKAIGIDSLQTDILSIKSSMGAYVEINDTDSKSNIYKTIIDLGIVPVILGSQEGSYGRIEVSSNSMEDGTLKLKLKADVDSALRLYAGCNVESEGEVDMVYIDTPTFEKVELSGEDDKIFENIKVGSPAELVLASGQAGVINYYADGVLDIGNASVNALFKNGYYVQIDDEDMDKIAFSKVGDIDPDTLIFKVNLDEEMYTLGKQLKLKKGELELLATCVFQKSLVTHFEINDEHKELLEEGTYDVSTLEGEDWIDLDGEQTSYEVDSGGGDTPSEEGKIRYAQAIVAGSVTAIRGECDESITRIDITYKGKKLGEAVIKEDGTFSFNAAQGFADGETIGLEGYEGETLAESKNITVGESVEIPPIRSVKVIVAGSVTAIKGKCDESITKIDITYKDKKLGEAVIKEDGTFSFNAAQGFADGETIGLKGYKNEGEEDPYEIEVEVQ